MEQNDHFIPDGMNDFERSVKRVGDCLLAFIGLIIFSPLFLICYLAVKHEDGVQPYSNRNVLDVLVVPSTFTNSVV